MIKKHSFVNISDMSKEITRTELEAIGQNWLNRRNKLLDYAAKKEHPTARRFRSLLLAFALGQRIDKIVLILGQQKPPKDFPSGGVAASIESMQPGEYVIAKPNFKK